MRVFIASLGLFFALQAHAVDLPDLLFRTGTGVGGYGRLSYDAGKNQYQLIDGRLTAYVVDGQKIRPMRADEGGGMMANPVQLVVLDGKIFANSTYGQILRLDPATGGVLETFSATPFGYGGSGSAAPMFGTDKALVILHGTRLISISHELKKIAEKDIPQQQRHVRFTSSYIQEGSKLYDIEFDNPSTYRDCVGDCDTSIYLRQTVIDLSNASDIKIESREEKTKEEERPAHKVVDGKGRGWFFVNYPRRDGRWSVSWRSFDRLAEAAATTRLEPEERVLAATTTAPTWMITQSKPGFQLRKAEKKKDIALSTFPLSWVKGSSPGFTLRQDGRFLYLASDYQLAVYDVSASVPKLLLQQDFVSLTGSGQFQMSELTPAVLPKARLKTDRSRLELLLKKDYFDDNDRLALHAEIEKLGASDTWAVDLFTALLKKRSVSYQGGAAYAIAALAKLGPVAESAVPDLVNACMEGSAIRGDVLAHVKTAIPKIDPSGKAVRAMLPACIKRNYVCEHVGKTLLEGLSAR